MGKLDDIGYLGNGPAVLQIFEGTYEFPGNCPPAARKLCVEASKLFQKTAEDVISKFVCRKDFQQWWLTANENMSSSKLGTHFGHYKVAAFDDYLSALHVAKLNLALDTGLPWSAGDMI